MFLLKLLSILFLKYRTPLIIVIVIIILCFILHIDHLELFILLKGVHVFIAHAFLVLVVLVACPSMVERVLYVIGFIRHILLLVLFGVVGLALLLDQGLGTLDVFHQAGRGQGLLLVGLVLIVLVVGRIVVGVVAGLDVVLEYAQFLLQLLLLLIIISAVAHGYSSGPLFDSLRIPQTIECMITGAAPRAYTSQHDDLCLLTRYERVPQYHG